jgi:hypothetical protein
MEKKVINKDFLSVCSSVFEEHGDKIVSVMLHTAHTNSMGEAVCETTAAAYNFLTLHSAFISSAAGLGTIATQFYESSKKEQFLFFPPYLD